MPPRQRQKQGLGAANNQAWAVPGETVLLLNPDTLLRPDTLEKALAYLDRHPGSAWPGPP
jgi:GT2 family glycosyltransferase